MGQRIQLHTFVVSQNQRDFGAAQCHARLLVDEYRPGRATCFTFFAVRTLEGISQMPKENHRACEV